VWAPAPARAGELVVAVNASNDVDEMSLQRLRLIYGGYKKTWSNGKPIVLLLPASASPAMEGVVAKLFKKQSEAEVAQYYLDLVFQGKLAKEPPKLAASTCLATVREQEGAIAVVDRDDARGATGVRLVPIEGL